MVSLSAKLGIAGAVIVIGLGLSFYSVFDMTDDMSTHTQLFDLDEYRAFAHTLGPSNAPVTIIEFGDFQCPFCSEWYVETKLKLDENYISQGQVQLIFVDYPFLGPDSTPAAYASYCAEEQGLYWEFHETLYLNQGEMNTGWANTENLKQFAAESGLNMEQFNTCFESDQYNDRLNQNLEAAKENAVNQTPTFVIIHPDGSSDLIEGKQPFEVFERLIQKSI